MPSNSALMTFIVASLIILLIPGPGVLYVVARSVSQGYRAGLISVVGLSVGALVHVAAATAGLTTLLLSSATAFGIVKALGAVYLLYLGFQTLFANRLAPNSLVPSPVPLSRLLIDGIVVSVFNPKIAVFFIAYLPQFVEPNHESVTHQILLLGLIYVLMALLTDGAYALLAGRSREWLNGRLLRSSLPRYVSGFVYLGLGINAALSGRRN